jgi:phenylpropionate dioxygenase-like ring-hydroxylating dioxygenase large terminal subunit
MFLRNAWYTAMWAKDLREKPIPRTILGDDVVLFRGKDGVPAALEDRCCHRAAPLSRGRVREKWNVVWIWMGDPAKADEAKITPLPWLDDPDWKVTPGYLHLEANGQLLVDNLLDFSHVT